MPQPRVTVPEAVDSAGGPLTRTDAAIAAAAFAATLALALAWLVPNHPWGDDFAGYLLQMRAIAAGDPSGEVARARELNGLTDLAAWPAAYPWGFPFLLFLWTRVFGAGLLALKLFQAVCLSTAVATTFVFGRYFLPRALALIAAALLAFQPDVLPTVNFVLSDLPFLALTTGAIAAAVAAQRRVLDGRGALAAAAAAGVLTAGAMTVRPTGVFLVAAFVPVMALVWLARPAVRRPTLLATIAFLAAVALVLLPYVAFFPRGAATQQVAMVNVAASSAVRGRVVIIAGEIARFAPLRVLNEFQTAAAFVQLLALAALAYAVWRRRWPALTPALFFAMSVGVLFTFPQTQGVRYLYPVVPVAGVLVLAGVRDAVAPSLAAVRLTPHRAGALVAALLVVLLVPALPPRQQPPWTASGPFSAAMRELAAFLEANVREGERVSFFKPRALRYVAGIDAIGVKQSVHMDRARWFVINKNEADGRHERAWQLPFSILERPEARLERVFENGQFLVLARPAAQ